MSQYTKNLLARSGQTLFQHTKEVIEYSKAIYGTGKFERELELAALFHDIGKAQPAYQHLFKTGERIGQLEHAVASAVILALYLGCMKSTGAINGDIDICVATKLVEGHHKGFRAAENEELQFTKAVKDAAYALQTVLESKDQVLSMIDKRNFLDKLLHGLLKVAKTNTYKETLIGIKGLLQNKERPVEDALFARQALGALAVADALSAAGHDPQILKADTKHLNPAEIDRFVKQVSKGRTIDQVREQIRQKVIQLAESVNLNKRVFSIALPTGAGKTLHALTFAATLRERIKKQTGSAPKVIYVMPYTTIIDQAYEVFRKIYGDSVDKRHYLAEEPKTPDEVPESLANIWNELLPADITVTTYVRLYSALFGNGRKDAIRSLAFRNAIIVMDEVQAIPYQHRSVVREMAKALAKDNWIVMMSATVPEILVPEDATPIVTQREIPNRGVFDRHKFVLKQWTYQEVIDNALSQFKSGKNVAIVVNTVRRAEELYRKIREQLGGQKTVEGVKTENGWLVYLSTYVPPFARKGRIDRFNERVLAVTTQVIEAGVDVSVDVMYRELAPLDSIVQAAGRCNRNGERDVGIVHVFEAEDTERSFKAVYGKQLWQATKNVLKDKKEFGDSDVDELLTMYYRELQRTGEDTSTLNELVENVKKCVFETRIKAIEEIPKIPVVVLYDEAKRILEDLKKEYSKPANERDRKRVSKLLRELGQYVVNVYPERAKNLERTTIGNVEFATVSPDDERNYQEDIGIIYAPEELEDIEDRMA